MDEETIKSNSRWSEVCKNLSFCPFDRVVPLCVLLTLLYYIGCEFHPDINLSTKKYGIKLFIPESDGMSEVWLKFDMEEQYCKWMAACKLASQGKTMADSSYENEVQNLKTLLSRQHLTAPPSSSPAIQMDIISEDYVAPRFYKKIKSKTVCIHK